MPQKTRRKKGGKRGDAPSANSAIPAGAGGGVAGEGREAGVVGFSAGPWRRYGRFVHDTPDTLAGMYAIRQALPGREPMQGEFLGAAVRPEDAVLMAGAWVMLRALKVLTLAPEIRAWLLENDPKALEQAEAAVMRAETEVMGIEGDEAGHGTPAHPLFEALEG